MKKAPHRGNAQLIANVHLEHEAQKFYKKFIRFSLDFWKTVLYCENGSREVLV